MDDVVRHPGVVRLLGEYLFENRASLELVGVGLVGGWRGGIQGERIEDRGLVIVRIAGVRAFHRLFVGNGSTAMITLVPVAIERLDRGEVVSLSLRLSRRRPSRGRGRPTRPSGWPRWADTRAGNTCSWRHPRSPSRTTDRSRSLP